MNDDRKVDTREIGLLIAIIFGKYFLKTEDLHYGYWSDDLAVEPANLPQAQENHSQLIISHIPPGTRSILDVGGGTGALARKLTRLGYEVDCVCPSTRMIELSPAMAERDFKLIVSTYEKMTIEKRYDLVLFSESFQYVNMKKSIPKTLDLLHDSGHLLICDFFKTDAPGKSPLSGGHRLSRFYRHISGYPFQPVEDIDITRFTAPNLDLVNDLLTNVGVPIRDLIDYALKANYPRTARLLERLFRKRIDKLDRKYFSGERNAKSFETFKSYRLLVYRKIPAPPG